MQLLAFAKTQNWAQSLYLCIHRRNSLQRGSMSHNNNKRPVHEANHSLSSNAEVKNECNYTSTPQQAFMVCTETSYLPLPLTC
jgi:hypothetical protein